MSVAMMLRLASLAILAAAFAAQARCDDAPDFQHPPYKHSFEKTERAAKSGNVDAEFRLGRDYEKALGVEQDVTQAIAWYKKAAKAGNGQAMLALGQIFLTPGPAQHREDPGEWILHAAQTGLPAAEIAEARYQQLGGSESEKAKKAFKDWVGQAAAQGDLEAAALLGPILLASDDQQEQTRGEAYVTAAEKAFPRTRFTAEALQFFRQNPKLDLKTARIPDKLRRAALTMDVEQADNGSFEAWGVMTFDMFVSGIGDFDNPELGPLVMRALEASAREGLLQSACNLALFELRQKDYDKAFTWYLSAAQRGAPRAEYHIGLLLRDGLGTASNPAAAAKWFYKAAVHGYMPAQAALGDLLFHGKGVPTDYQAALGWLRPAAAYGNPMAQFDLGLMYLNGLGVSKDVEHAVALINAAAQPVTMLPWPPAAEWIKAAQSNPALKDRVAGAMTGGRPFTRGIDDGEGGCDEQSLTTTIEE